MKLLLFLLVASLIISLYLLLGYYRRWWRSPLYTWLGFCISFLQTFLPVFPFASEDYRFRLTGGLVLGLLFLQINNVLVKDLLDKLPNQSDEV